MFSTFRQRLLLGVYIFLILSVPTGAYLVSQNQTTKSSASEPKSKSPIIKTTPKPAGGSSKSAAKQLISLSPTPTPEGSSSATIATSFGPTLSLKVSLEGRSQDNQASRLFVGIVQGGITVNPKFLLSFTVDLPLSGEYGNLSLAGLEPGTNYTALLKGPAQIATSSAFLMSPTVTHLNDDREISLLSGDLNEDNVVNSADYSIAKSIFGATSASQNWNDNADFNKDGKINSLDLGFIIKNFGKVGESGAWGSPIPKVATSSGSLTPQPIGSSATSSGTLPTGSQGGSTSGYWIWIPGI